MVVITYVDRRQQSISGLFLDINLVIYYAKETIIYMIKKQAEKLRRRRHKVFEPRCQQMDYGTL